jgi:hypothetical protein
MEWTRVEDFDCEGLAERLRLWVSPSTVQSSHPCLRLRMQMDSAGLCFFAMTTRSERIHQNPCAIGGKLGLELVSKHERQPGQNREPLVDVAHMYPVSWKYICTTHCLTQAPCGSAQTFPAHQSVRLLRVILACPCRFFSAARPGLSAVTTSPSVATCTMSFLRVGCFRWLVPHLEATPRSPLR